jgi:hypothetical protein
MPNLLAYLSCVRSVALSRPNWSRVADVRELIARHLPARCREQHIWRHVADQLAAAARGGSIDNAVVSLRLALQLERVPRLPQ